MIEIDLDPKGEPRVLRPGADTFVVTFHGGDQRITVHLDAAAAEQLHADLATALERDCKPRSAAEVLSAPALPNAA